MLTAVTLPYRQDAVKRHQRDTGVRPVSQPAAPQRTCFPGSCGRFSFRVLLPQVTQYLLDRSFVMDEDSLYESSLRMEPKLPT